MMPIAVLATETVELSDDVCYLHLFAVYTLEQLDEVHAPIGIPLGGQLPEEIAVSIMAEIIKVKISIIPHTVMKK